MNAKLFKFDIQDFEEVYAIIDQDRLHISSVFYSYSITLDLSKELTEQLDQWTQWEEVNFRNRAKKVINHIIAELEL